MHFLLAAGLSAPSFQSNHLIANPYRDLRPVDDLISKPFQAAGEPRARNFGTARVHGVGLLLEVAELKVSVNCSCLLVETQVAFPVPKT